MSKSKGNIFDPLYLLDEKRYQVDAFRYYLLSQVEFGWDGTFSEELLIEKYNSDLANDIGNLLNRSITMVEKYFGGEIPEALACDGCSSDEINSLSKDLYECAVSLPEKVSSAMAVETNGPDFQSALKALWSLIDRSNKYIERCAPWKCAKADDKKALQVIMGHLMQSLGITAALLYPFMPETACKLITQIGADGYINCDTIRFSDIKWGMIRTGTKVAKGAPCFPRLEKENDHRYTLPPGLR
jgi:methionyl-tRNA synthetase